MGGGLGRAVTLFLSLLSCSAFYGLFGCFLSLTSGHPARSPALPFPLLLGVATGLISHFSVWYTCPLP